MPTDDSNSGEVCVMSLYERSINPDTRYAVNAWMHAHHLYSVSMCVTCGDEPWRELYALVDDMVSARMKALAATLPEQIERVIERYGGAVRSQEEKHRHTEFGNPWYSDDDRRAADAEFESAERELRALIAVAGQRVVDDAMVQNAVSERYKPGEYTWDNQGPFTETHERMRAALEAALAPAKEPTDVEGISRKD